MCSVFSYFCVYTACASSLASRHQSLDQSPLFGQSSPAILAPSTKRKGFKAGVLVVYT